LLRTQNVFGRFEILQLHKPLQQANNPEFATFLDSIGNDCNNNEVDLSQICHTQSIDNVINFVFPPEILEHPEMCMQQAILCPYNKFIDKFNALIRDIMPGDQRTYFSSDSIDNDSMPSNNEVQPLATQDYLNALTEPGIPPHELILKVGSVCWFTWNFLASKGITKNTCVIVRRLLQYSIEVTILPLQIGCQTLSSVIFLMD
jgi:hypothetical protein